MVLLHGAGMYGELRAGGGGFRWRAGISVAHRRELRKAATRHHAPRRNIRMLGYARNIRKLQTRGT